LSVVEAVNFDLEQLGEDLSKTSLAASALALAAEMDEPGNSATSKSMCAKALLETMDRLRQLAPPKREKTRRDELADKRATRRKRVSGRGASASHPPGS
jgi:hypothetical protein